MILDYLPIEFKVLYKRTVKEPQYLVRAIEIVKGKVLKCYSAENKKLLPDYYHYNQMNNLTLIPQELLEAIDKQLKIQESYKI